MNVYRIIILATLVGKYLVDLISQWLNIRAMRPELPQELVGYYDSEKFSKSQEYTRTRTRFHIISSTFSLIVLLLFWFLGGFNELDLMVRSWGFPTVPTGLCYIGILVLLSSLLSLPFDLHSTFGIEERFGFNKTTISTFVMDRVKGLILMAILGGAAWPLSCGCSKLPDPRRGSIVGLRSRYSRSSCNSLHPFGFCRSLTNILLCRMEN